MCAARRRRLGSSLARTRRAALLLVVAGARLPGLAANRADEVHAGLLSMLRLLSGAAGASGARDGLEVDEGALLAVGPAWAKAVAGDARGCANVDAVAARRWSSDDEAGAGVAATLNGAEKLVGDGDVVSRSRGSDRGERTRGLCHGSGHLDERRGDRLNELRHRS